MGKWNWNPITKGRHIVQDIISPTRIYRPLAKGPLKGVNPEPFKGINPEPFKGVNPQPFKGWDWEPLKGVNPEPFKGKSVGDVVWPFGKGGSSTPATPLPTTNIPHANVVANPAGTTATGNLSIDYLLGKDIPAYKDAVTAQWQAPPEANFASLLGTYAPALQQAAGGLEAAIARAAGMTGAANAKTRSQIANAYAATGADQGAANAADVATVNKLAGSLGLERALAGTGMQNMKGQAARLAGLANTAQAGAMSNLDFLQNARQGAYQTLMPMGRAMAAQGTAGLANTLAQAQVQDTMNRHKAQSDYELAAIEGMMKARQTAQTARDNEIRNRINIAQLTQAAQKQGTPINIQNVDDPDIRKVIVDAMSTPNPYTQKLPSPDEVYSTIYAKINELQSGLNKKHPDPKIIDQINKMQQALPLVAASTTGFKLT